MTQHLTDLAQGQHYPAGALYIVATPIGNVADITLRALHVLGLVDRVAAEDTRNTAQLLSRYGISKPSISVHEHNERSAAERVIEHLRNGERIACVSDAGTPAMLVWIDPFDIQWMRLPHKLRHCRDTSRYQANGAK
jgi:16S rRNA (cytidine1402-2'-O)-methyltransferase